MNSTFTSIRENLASVVLALTLLFLAVVSDLPYVRSEAGNTYEATGSVNDEPLLMIEENAAFPTYKSSGQILILTVSSWGGPYGRLTWVDAMRTFFDSDVVIVPTSFLFDPDQTSEDISNQGSQLFLSAESNAIAAAMEYLKLPVSKKLIIGSIFEETPAVENYKLGDVLLQLNGIALSDFESITKIMDDVKPGESVTYTLIRDGNELEVSSATIENDGRTIVGIGILEQTIPPVDIEVQLPDVKGPSAGLAFAISLVELFSKKDFTQNRIIGVTGEITANGDVKAIGGLDHKINGAYASGARLMLIPRENCNAVPKATPQDLRLVPVTTLEEALEVLLQPNPKSYPKC
ncbi:MAG: PDZ domain-containing protein [Candidatus Nanopelagicales bacterium]